jgi:hypothetical protein
MVAVDSGSNTDTDETRCTSAINGHANTDPLSAAVRFAAERPDVLERMMRDHAPDESGHCRRCRYQLLPKRWPCTIARIAQLAQDALKSNPRPKPSDHQQKATNP